MTRVPIRPLAAALVVLLLPACGGHGSRRAPADWHQMLSQRDRLRLHDWRTAWVQALGQAKAEGVDGRIAREGRLLDPDAAVDAAMPPDGAYRCRTLKLGAQTRNKPAFAAFQRYHCRITDGLFVKLDGAQRPAGRFWRDDETGRLVFLGAATIGDEKRIIGYGRDPDRDVVGFVERVEPRRWRLVMPYPRWESMLDVLELVPGD